MRRLVQDQQMYDYLRHYGLDGIVVATKADKVCLAMNCKMHQDDPPDAELGPEDLVIPVSALKNRL